MAGGLTGWWRTQVAAWQASAAFDLIDPRLIADAGLDGVSCPSATASEADWNRIAAGSGSRGSRECETAASDGALATGD